MFKSHEFLWCWGLCATYLGCGYHPLYAEFAQRPLAVQLGQVLVPEPLAAQAAASGARTELAAAGAVRGGSEYPRLVLDVLRVDELSRGIHVEQGRPRSAGMSIAVTVRGRVFQAAAQDPVFDSGDLRRAVQMAGEGDASADGTAYDLALRQAAELSGRAIARAVLGIPEPADEAP